MAAPVSISDISCAVLDMLLMLSFDWRELSDLGARLGMPRDVCGDTGLEPEVEIFLAAHRATHRCARFAASLQRHLNLRYRKTISEVRAAAEPELWARVRRAPLAELASPGLLWALASDPRTDVSGLASSLQYRLQASALRQFSFAAPDA